MCPAAKSSGESHAHGVLTQGFYCLPVSLTLLILFLFLQSLFWKSVSKKTQITLPQSLTELLTHLGYDNEAALRSLTKESIDHVQSFARRILSKVSLLKINPRNSITAKIYRLVSSLNPILKIFACSFS